MNRFEALKIAQRIAPWVISVLALLVALIVCLRHGKIPALVVLFFALCGLALFHFIRDGILS